MILNSDFLNRAKWALHNRRVKNAVRRQGFWFVDVPRTSSTAVRLELARKFGPVNDKLNVLGETSAVKQMLGDHIRARRMRQNVGPDIWDRIFVFSIVRNPWDRISSLFFYIKKLGHLPEDMEFSDFILQLETATADTPCFEHRTRRLAAADYLIDADGKLIVDYIVRFENREEGLREVAQKIGFPELGQKQAQKASPTGRHYSSYYNTRTRDIVAKRFAIDLEMFGYEFENLG